MNTKGGKGEEGEEEKMEDLGDQFNPLEMKEKVASPHFFLSSLSYFELSFFYSQH